MVAKWYFLRARTQSQTLGLINVNPTLRELRRDTVTLEDGEEELYPWVLGP